MRMGWDGDGMGWGWDGMGLGWDAMGWGSGGMEMGWGWAMEHPAIGMFQACHPPEHPSLS